MTCETMAWFYRGREAFHEARGTPIERAFTAAERVTLATPDRARRACAPGCGFCCHQPVGVSHAEAVALAEAIASDAQARERVRAACAERTGATWQQLAERRARCPLLGDDERCTAYAVRPLGCRGWSSTSREACARAFAGHGAAEPDAAAFVACLGVATELGEARFELVAAVAHLLGCEPAARADPRSLAHCPRAGG